METQMEIDVYDDPCNPFGWATDPALRTLRAAAPDATWRLHPTVLVEDWERYRGGEFPGGKQSVAAVCSRVSEESGMPIDEYLWFSDPPSTTRHACRGFAAALAQGSEPGWRFLRAAREATFLRQTNLDTVDAVVDLADSVPGLDADEFAATLSDDAIETPDPDSVAGPNGDRPDLPTLVVAGPEGERSLSGRVDDRQLARAVEAATGEPFESPDLAVREVVDRFSPEGWLATVELSALSGRGHDAVVEAARNADDVVEAEFASESFFREAEFVPESVREGVDADGSDA